MKRLITLSLLAVVACAPAPEQTNRGSSHRYLARAQQVIDVIADTALKVKTESGDRLWRVERRSPSSIYLNERGSSLYGSSLVLFVATEHGVTTTVTDSSAGKPTLKAGVQAIYDALSQRFTEIR